ncbi:MAG: DUF2341 domain-containing protein, partial [bacterium]
MGGSPSKLALSAVWSPTATFTTLTDFSPWQRKVPMTFSGYNRTEPLTNFPVLVVLGTNVDGFAYNQFQSGNADLAFADAAQSNELKYEIERWDTNGNSYVWVQVPQLAATNTAIWAYWGRAGLAAPAFTTNGATWANGYLSVYHLSGTDTGTVGSANSASATNTLANGGGVSNQVNCPVGYGARFEGGTNDTHYLTVGRYAGFPAAGQPFTFSGWFNMTVSNAVTDWRNLVGVYQTNVPPVPHVAIRDLGGTMHSDVYTGADINVFANNLYTTGRWYYAAMIYQGGTEYFSVDGVLQNGGVGSNVLANYSGGLELDLARQYSARSPCLTKRCLQDEVRVSTVARSTNWIWAEWFNMASNSAFVSSGLVGPPTVRNEAATNVTAAAANLNGYLASTGAAPTTVRLYWGTNDGGTVAANWGNTNDFGVRAPGPVTLNVGLAPSMLHYYRYYATNDHGESWATPAAAVGAVTLSVNATDPTASENGPDPAVFTISRPSWATGATISVNYAVTGSAVNGVDYSNLTGSV